MENDFPQTRDMAPLNPVFERAIGNQQTEISFSETPPVPRQWLFGRSSNEIIQVQQDRFIYNWKRDTDTHYPSYERVFGIFTNYLDQFTQHIRSTGTDDILHKQYEMTYVNIIDIGDHSAELFNDHIWRTGKRFLPTPETFVWRSSFSLPSSNGRLHAKAQTVMSLSKEQKKAVRLEVTARGYPNNDAMDMAAWFDIAHEWITHGFVDLTNHDIQVTEWGRTQ